MSDAVQQRSRRDIIAGAIFIAIAAGFAIEGLNYPLGTPLRMGPGFMPVFLAGILAVLGLVTLVMGLRRSEMIVPTPVAWRGMALIVAALIIFGAFARQLGLVPAVFICAFLTALASRNNNIVSALLIAAAMSALCWLIFEVGLGVTLPTFGTLFRF
jgi:hypothetical protein